jgi:hypothetical protein
VLRKTSARPEFKLQRPVFHLRPDGKSGYLSSNRPGSQYLDENNKACCNDIFIRAVS